MAEIYQLPENGNSNGGFGNIPFSIPIGGFLMKQLVEQVAEPCR